MEILAVLVGVVGIIPALVVLELMDRVCAAAQEPAEFAGYRLHDDAVVAVLRCGPRVIGLNADIHDYLVKHGFTFKAASGKFPNVALYKGTQFAGAAAPFALDEPIA